MHSTIIGVDLRIHYMPTVKTLLMLAVIPVFASCAVVPGSNIDARTDERVNEQLSSQVNIYPITAELVASLNSAGSESPAVFNSTTLSDVLRTYEYRIGRGDLLYITVYGHPELTAPAGSQSQPNLVGNLVRSDGTIFYPYIGSVLAAGRTIEEVRSEISNRISEYIAEPQVDARVLGFRSQRTYITGQVNSPGPQPITNVPLTIVNAVNAAGGLTPNANWHDAILVREGGERISISLHELLNNGRLDQNRLLRDGDVLNVPEVGNKKVFVLGELNSVNAIAMGNLSISLTDAITQSGGINQMTANASGIFVIRQAPPGVERLADVYQLDARNALAFALGARFMLQPQDIVYVTTVPISRWNRVLSQILPSLSSLLVLDNIGEQLTN